MINLLPENEKKVLTVIRWQKIIAIIGALIIYFIVALSLILWAISVNISSEKKFKEIMAITEEGRLNNSETNAVKTKIAALNDNLVKIDTQISRNKWLTETIKKISGGIPSGVYLTNISYQDKQFMISGFAPTREDLLIFKENLEKENDFKKINFPPIDWVKPKAIIFSVTFSIDK